ncbi:hypothetical protein CPB83DRAFT_852224 [Crepidotus variabilis]|uniref:TM7S3/TM198-like domain-containing protein n=1 Tax=Crepidotus variabilis TaxID=179855 RepID=A0A9P6JRD8_9AGAR|nr:hypothetical protein CPB83DRAFT_852224 [Crepidotus variabilis]
MARPSTIHTMFSHFQPSALAFVLMLFLFSTVQTSNAVPLQLDLLRSSISSQSNDNLYVPDSSKPSYNLWSPFIILPHFRQRTNAEVITSTLSHRDLELPSQGPATDGGGKGYDGPAIMWIVFTLVIGPPMALAGFKGARISSGVGAGLFCSMSAWLAIVNSVGSDGIPDLVLNLVSLVFFAVGFFCGFFKWGRYVGMVCLGLEGGLALGVRFIILRPGLLVNGLDLFKLNWAIVLLLGAIGGMAVVPEKTQRWALLVGCASIGSFLTFLGADLIIHKQSGMSRGLRLLYDRNASHFQDNVAVGYKPSIVVMILVGVSIGVTLILACGQSYFFKAPFDSWKQVEEDKDGSEAIGISQPTRGTHTKAASFASF